MIRVFFRYDDYSAVSPQAVDLGLIDVLRRNGLSATFAVIPSRTRGDVHEPGDRDEERLQGPRMSHLSEAVQDGVVQLALHGWNHRTHAGALPPDPSEFRDLPYADQLDRLRRGLHLLELGTGRRPRIFVPPWNTYDRWTIRALEELGIECIAANREGPVLAKKTTMRFAPMTIELPALRAAIRKARESGDEHAIIGVMMHPYDFAEDPDSSADRSLSDFEDELRWLKSQPDVGVTSLEELLSTDVLDVRRYRANQVAAIERLLPAGVPRTNDNPVYHSTRSASRARTRRALVAVGYHSAIAITAALVAALIIVALGRAGLPLGPLVMVGASLLVLALVVRAARNRALYFRGMALISAFSGIALGSLAGSG